MRSPKAICFCSIFLLVSYTATTLAQTDSAALNIDSLSAIVAAFKPDDALSDVEKAQAGEAAESALQQLGQTMARAQRTAEYTKTASNSSAMITELKLAIAAFDSDMGEVPMQGSVETLRTTLDSLKVEHAENSATLQQLREAQNLLAVRGPGIVTEIASIRGNLPTLETTVAANSNAPQGSPAFALQSLALTRLLDNRLAVADLQLELSSIPARQAIIEQSVLLAELRVARLAARTEMLTESLGLTRVGRAETALATAQDELLQLAGASLPVRGIAEQNLALSQRLSTMAAEQREIDLSSALLQQQIATIEQSRQVVERVLATGRLTDELGILLRNVHTRQLRIAPLERRVRRNEEARIAQELNPIIWQERLQRLAAPDAIGQLITEATASGAIPFIVSAAESATVANLIEQRKLLVGELIDSARISRDSLIAEAILLATIIDKTEALTDLLDRRLLWLRNQDPIARDWIINLPASFAWLLDPRAWYGAAQEFLQQILKNPLLGVLAVLVPALVWINRKRLRRVSQSLAANVGHVGKDTYFATPLALLILCLLAMFWPLLVGAVAGILALGDDPGLFSIALIPSLTALALLIFLLNIFRMLSQPQGLFASHFQWSEISLHKLHTNLLWFTWVLCIATFVFTMAINSVEPTIRYSLGLLGFVALSIGMAVMAYMFMNPMNGILVNISARTEPSFWQKPIFPLLVVIPLVIGVTSLTGYFDTAVMLQTMVFQSGLLLLLVVVIHGLLQRILDVAHRRFALRQIRQVRAHAEIEREALALSGTDGAESESESDDHPDLVDPMSQQLRSTIFSTTLLLLGLGIWLIWRPLFPTIGIADDVVLWQGTRTVDGVSSLQGITLWNLCLALLFLFGGMYLARNIRGFLEVGLFGRLTLDAGARYAAVSITGYLIVAVTALIGLGQLGIDWSKMQWIVAALGVGLGFGLQEIVANFVSGLIILFERPVRVGDTVTIGELSGTVSKISIRATTVMDFDNREVLLPNKSIITDNVVNWTLNNPVTRIVIKIGVAYGSDLNQVHGILLGLATAHDEVLETPVPLVFLIEHGDSSINFEMRVYVATPAMRWPVAHDLNIAINTAFASKGIQIPFPQRDVHLFNHEHKKATPLVTDT